jgi:hypothetical protein
MMQGTPGEDSKPISIAIVPDGRDGKRVYARPARPDETSEGVWIGDDETLIMRIEASHVWVDNEPDPVRVVPDGREGNKVFARRLDPTDADSGEVVRWIPDEEQLVLTIHASYAGIHSTSEVGRENDLITSMRLLPDGREGSIVYARTLAPNEVDTGETVQIRPGDTVRIRPGKLIVALDTIDTTVDPFEDGYVPLTNTLRTWMALFGSDAPDDVRLLLAASRRLDASHRLLRLVRSGLDDLEQGQMGVYAQRVMTYETIGTVELAVVGLNRALQMTSQISRHVGSTISVPSVVITKLPAIKALRNAYEHIEDRAMGRVRGQPDSTALTVFDYERLFHERVVAYGEHTLALGEESTQLCLEAREYLKSAAAELTERRQLDHLDPP